MTMLERARVKAKVLEEYRRGDTLKEIEVRHDVAVASISLWAKAAGLKRRKHRLLDQSPA